MNLSYYVEEKKTNSETPLQFSVHTQETIGKNTMVYAHIHDYIEILYALSGEFQIFLNNNEYSFSTGDIVLINSNEIHNIIALSEGVNKYIVIKFIPELLYTTTQSLFEIKYVTPFILNESNHQKIFKKAEIEKTIIPAIIYDILEEYQQKAYGYELAIRAGIFNLFLFILRRWHEENVDLNIHQDINRNILARMQVVFDFIDENYQNEITASDMANLCGLSYSYFSRLFKKIKKRKFKEYLNYVRISKSEKLLITSNYNITEIAMMVGFTTTSYFITQFKQFKGISPKKFQIKIKLYAE